MLWLKNNYKFLILFIFLFSNLWIYKVLDLNIFIGVGLILLTILIGIFLDKKWILIFLTIFLLFLQLQTQPFKSLVILDNDQQRVMEERIRSYPLTYIPIFGKNIWLKPEERIEQNKFVLALSKVEENILNTIDFNYYFFAGFPKDKPEDYQKFSFILLPIFLIGIYAMISIKKFQIINFLFLAPLLLISLTGFNLNFGPIALLPFFIISVSFGFKFLISKFKNPKLFLVIFFAIYILTIIMQISYEKF